MKNLLTALALTLTLSTAAYAGCRDVGNVIEVTQSHGYTSVETSDGFFVLSGPRAVAKSPGRERACYDAKNGKFCYPTPGGERCEIIE